MRQWFILSTKSQADLLPFIQGNSFRLPHTYLNIFFSEITGLFDDYSLDCLGHLTKMAAPPYMAKQNLIHYKLQLTLTYFNIIKVIR